METAREEASYVLFASQARKEFVFDSSTFFDYLSLFQFAFRLYVRAQSSF